MARQSRFHGISGGRAFWLHARPTVISMQTGLAWTALLMGLAGGPHCAAMCGAACGGLGRVANARRPWLGTLQLQAGLDGFLAVEKYLLVKRGLFAAAHRRRPYHWELDAETAAEVDRLFARMRAALT